MAQTQTSAAEAPVPIHTALRGHARRWPDALAIDSADGCATYLELDRRVGRIRSGLQALRVVPGEVVVVRGDAGLDQSVATLAVLACGAVALPLPAAEPGGAARAAVAAVGARIELAAPGAGAPLAGLSRHAPSSLADVAGDLARPREDSAGGFACLSSGSSGTARRLAHSHAALAQLASWFVGHLRIGPGDRVAQWSQPGYDAQLVELAVAVSSGAALCPVPPHVRLEPARLLDWAQRAGITVLQTVPSFARALTRAAERDGSPRPLSLGSLVFAGEPLDGELADRARTRLGASRVVNLYGSSETILATYYDVQPNHGPGPVPVGTAIPGREVVVTDADGKPCPPGVTGEIVVTSPYVAAGVGEPVTGGRRRWATGDLGEVAGGVLWFRGRRDDQVKVSGRRLVLSGIEQLVSGVAGVQECAVVAATGRDGVVDRLVAHLEVDPERYRPVEVRAALRAGFGESVPPLRLVAVERLPRNRGGKLDRRSLGDPFPADSPGPPEGDRTASPPTALAPSAPALSPTPTQEWSPR